MSKLTPELRLKKLRRLECNLMCPNCGTTAPQGLGFGNVCVKFNTFICDLCKTSHQAISHRVKSITMSNWTNEEVDVLTTEYGGGNEAALHIWLQNAPGFGQKYRGGSRPKEGDRIEVFKKFVADCYDSGMFKATTPFVPNASHSTSAAASAPTSCTKPAAKAPAQAAAPVSPGKIARPPADPFGGEASLFDDFHAGSGSASPKPSGGHVTDPFGSGFSSSADLVGQPLSVSAPSNTNTAGLLFDAFDDTPSSSPFTPTAFGASTSAQASSGLPLPPAPAASSFDFMSASTDPFSNFTSSANSNSNTNKGSAGFSSFNSFNSDVAVAPSTSGFDFMAADPFANSSSIASSNNASRTDLFGFGTPLSVSPVPPAAAAQPVDDPFGSVFLHPVSSTSAGNSVSNNAAAGVMNAPARNNVMAGSAMSGSSPYNNSASPAMLNTGMGMGMGMGMGVASRGTGMMGGPVMGGPVMGGNGGGHSPVGNPAMNMNNMNNMNGNMNMGMNSAMRAPAMGMGAGPMGAGPMSGGPMSGGMGGGMSGGMGGAGMAYRAAPPAAGRMDAIGDAFGGLNIGLGGAGSSPRGAPVPQQGPASFDFLQGTMKQQLSSLPAGSGGGAGAGAGRPNPMGAMGARTGAGMGGGMGQQQYQGYPAQR